MLGKHHVVVESLHLKYEFTIRRNITVIQGDSATGKTTLIELLREHQIRGKLSPVKIESDVPCVVYMGTEDNWKLILDATEHSIVFIDEGYSFIFTREFAEVICNTDNYYVLITRKPLTCLPYSIKEIYGIRTSGKYHFPAQVYHEFYQIYDESIGKMDPQQIIFIVEDAKSGFQFVNTCCGDKIACISAEGNSNIYQTLREVQKDKKLIVMADGAAFGAFVAKILTLAKIRQNICLYLPESFEWIVLKSGIFKIKELTNILENPEDYIDSCKFFSWERFFTAYLEQLTQNDSIRCYQKQKLSSFYLEGKNKQQILDVFPELIRNVLPFV